VSDRCARAEILAGAIALDEATAAERDEYRRHIAGCARCLNELRGEREIERVMSTVVDARESETWDPVPVRWREPARTRRRVFATGAFAVASAVALALGLHATIGVSSEPASPAQIAVAPTVRETIFHVALESRPHPKPKPTVVAAAAPAPAPKRVNAPRLVVVHSVITRRGNNVTQTTIATTEVADAPIPQMTAPPSNVPIWRRDEAMPRANVPSPAPVLTGRAESIAVAPVPIVRDVEPIGGDAAINPRPAPIAYAENAYGTTAFEVTVDERGLPVRCAITKSSGFAALDVSVCKAAMTARYQPRLINGKATLGVYRDAFTFRELSDQDDNQY
jgi:TonB family protein